MTLPCRELILVSFEPAWHADFRTAFGFLVHENDYFQSTSTRCVTFIYKTRGTPGLCPGFYNDTVYAYQQLKVQGDLSSELSGQAF